MKAIIAVMAREVMARRELPLMAAAVAFMISLLPFLPNIQTFEATDVRTVASSVSALTLGCVLALLLGATVFGNDLSEGRLGFFFARPVSGLAVWWGRVLAVMALVWVVEIIVLTPALYHEGIRVITSSDGTDRLTILAYVVAPLLLFLLAHAVSILVRAGTPWLFLDLGGAMAVAVLAWLNLKPLIEIGAPIAMWVVAGALVAALLISLSVGGASGVAVGRVDLRRVHRAQSLALWSTMAICLAAITVYGNWLRDFGPQDFGDVEVRGVAPNGKWAEVVGNAPGRLDVSRRCLISTIDGRWLPLPGRAYGFPDEVIYSNNAGTAMWWGAEVGRGLRNLSWADLEGPDPSVRQSNIFLSPEAHFTLSADGSRVAVLEEGTLSVFEVGDERLLTAVKLSEDLRQATVFFPSNDTLRIFARLGTGDEVSLVIAKVDATTGKITRTGQIEGLAGDSLLVVDAGLERVVTWSRPKVDSTPVRSVYDAANGGLVRLLDSTGFPRFLQDGRVLLSSENRDGGLILIAEPIEGGDRITHTVDDAAYFNLHGEAMPNWVVVSQLADPSDRNEGRRIDIHDVDTGEVRNIGTHVRRGLSWLPWQLGDAGAIFWYRDQMEASRFFVDQSGALVRWDPETGDLVHVVGGRK